MPGDFNRKGNQYETLATAGEPAYYGLLIKQGGNFWSNLQRHLCDRWKDDLNSPELKRWSACLECLQSTFYQVKRISAQNKKLCSVIPPPDQMVGQSGIEAVADFESLLYFSRSTLDRLTFAVAKQTHGQKCEKIQKLPNVLKNFAYKDERASRALDVIEASLPSYQGLLIDYQDGRTGLRSLLAHSRTTGEALTNVFTVHRDPTNLVLRFDLELDGFGVINETLNLSQAIAFTTLSIIGIYSEFPQSLNFEDCSPSWDTKAVMLSKFIDLNNRGPKFSTIRVDACGFQIITKNVRTDLFRHAERINIGVGGKQPL